jgi:hypothetical protein
MSIRKKIPLAIFLVILAFIATGQTGLFSGCQCVLPVLSYQYEVPYCTANNPSPDRVLLLSYVKVEYYDAQNQLLSGSDEKYLVKVARGSVGVEPSEQFPPSDAINNFKSDTLSLNIPNNAVKAKVTFSVQGHYLLDDTASNYYDPDDGIEAYLKNIYLGTTKVTGWTIASSDTSGVFQAVAEITSDGTLHGKFIGADTHNIDQGFVDFVAEVPLH